MKTLRHFRIAVLFLLIAIYTNYAFALPRYVVTDLGSTGQVGDAAPNGIWRLTESNETILKNKYLATSGSINLPAGTDLAYGPTADGYVYVRYNDQYKWWHPDGRPVFDAPSRIEALSGSGWSARGDQFGIHPRILRYPPLAGGSGAMEVYRAPDCDPQADSCFIAASGASNGGDTIGSWIITPFENSTISGTVWNSSLFDACAPGPMNDAGAFIFGTNCTGQITWHLSVGGIIPSPSNTGTVTWNALNSSNQIVGKVVEQNLQSFGVISHNSSSARLDNLIDAGSGFQISVAYAINERGSILAVGYRNGNTNDPRALLLTEAPKVVNIATDNTDMDAGDGICDGSPDPGEQCSLRAAIQEANYSPGLTEIRFAIPGSGTPVINLARELPEIDQPIRILGSTQPGGQVAIDGSRTGIASSGLTLTNARGSVISGLRLYGFDLNGINIFLGGETTIQGNVLGLAPDGTSKGFGGYGIYIGDSNDNRIGGTQVGQGNTIANGGVGGIGIDGTSIRNSVLSNSIFGNAGMGIDLGNDGGTPNHGIGIASGPNYLQNAPVLASVSNGLVQGTLVAEPLRRYRIEVFSSECSGSRGQGQTLLGSLNVDTDMKGQASFEVSVAGSGAFTATATDQDGNTSEFSPILASSDAVGGACINTAALKNKNSSVEDGRGKLNFQCPNGGQCSGTIVLQYFQKGTSKMLRISLGKYITIAKSSFSSKANGSVTVSYSLNKKGKMLLQKHKGKLSAVAIVTAKGQSGIRSGATFKVSIKLK